MSNGTCGCSDDMRFAAIRTINEGKDSIQDGIFDIRVGLNSIKSGFITAGTNRCCEGSESCKEGACDIAAGLKVLRPELSSAERREACEGLRDIRKGLCGINQGINCVRQGNVNRGSCAIEAELSSILEGLADILDALCDIL